MNMCNSEKTHANTEILYKCIFVFLCSLLNMLLWVLNTGGIPAFSGTANISCNIGLLNSEIFCGVLVKSLKPCRITWTVIPLLYGQMQLNLPAFGTMWYSPCICLRHISSSSMLHAEYLAYGINISCFSGVTGSNKSLKTLEKLILNSGFLTYIIHESSIQEFTFYSEKIGIWALQGQCTGLDPRDSIELHLSIKHCNFFFPRYL